MKVVHPIPCIYLSLLSLFFLILRMEWYYVPKHLFINSQLVFLGAKPSQDLSFQTAVLFLSSLIYSSPPFIESFSHIPISSQSYCRLCVCYLHCDKCNGWWVSFVTVLLWVTHAHMCTHTHTHIQKGRCEDDCEISLMSRTLETTNNNGLWGRHSRLLYDSSHRKDENSFFLTNASDFTFEGSFFMLWKSDVLSECLNFF